MEILLNGERRELPPGQTVAVLLQASGRAQARVAVEVNREIVPRSLHSSHLLSDGDRVEIIQAMGGG